MSQKCGFKYERVQFFKLKWHWEMDVKKLSCNFVIQCLQVENSKTSLWSLIFSSCKNNSDKVVLLWFLSCLPWLPFFASAFLLLLPQLGTGTKKKRNACCSCLPFQDCPAAHPGAGGSLQFLSSFYLHCQIPQLSLNHPIQLKNIHTHVFWHTFLLNIAPTEM